MKTIRLLILLTMIYQLFCFAQVNPWIEYKLPSPSTQYKAAVGETCIIFVENNGDTVKAFDIFSKQWHEYLVDTELPWCPNKIAAASGNTALVYNDSILLAFSALTQSFYEIQYSGSLLLDNANFYGCEKNMAYFLTDEFLYVFDASEGLWYNFDYEPANNVYSYIKHQDEDYFYFVLNGQDYQIIAFSNITHTIQQISSTEQIYVTPLDSGFVWRDGEGAFRKFGVFSASTGNFNNIDLGEIKYVEFYYQVKSPSGQSEPTISNVYYAIFCCIEYLGPNTICHSYAADKRTGSMYYQSYGFDYINNSLGWRGAGSEFCIYGLVYLDSLGNPIDHYFALSNSLSGGFQNPMQAPLLIVDNTLPQYFTGGDLLFGQSKTQLMGFNCNSLSYSISGLAENFYRLKFASGNNWATITGRVSDTLLYVYSYNSNTNQIRGPIIKRSNYSIADIAGINVYAVTAANSDMATQILFYSPLLDEWSEYDQGFNSFIMQGYKDYVAVIYPDINQTLIYNGVSGNRTWLPFGNMYNYKGDDYSFITYSNNGYSLAYSSAQNDWVEFTGPATGTVMGNEGIKLLSGNNYYYLLVYNSLTNEFIPTTLSQNQGSRLHWIAGGKTALVITLNGYLLAMDPQVVVSIDDPYPKSKISKISYELDQNYPNPFNSSTKISWQSPVGSYQTIKVFDVLGNQIATLVDEFNPQEGIKLNSIHQRLNNNYHPEFIYIN